MSVRFLPYHKKTDFQVRCSKKLRKPQNKSGKLTGRFCRRNGNFPEKSKSATITDFIGEQQGYKKSYNTPYYLPDVSESSEGGGGGGGSLGELDERFEEAAKMVVTTQRGSTSDLQRKLGMASSYL